MFFIVLNMYSLSVFHLLLFQLDWSLGAKCWFHRDQFCIYKLQCTKTSLRLCIFCCVEKQLLLCFSFKIKPNEKCYKLSCSSDVSLMPKCGASTGIKMKICGLAWGGLFLIKQEISLILSAKWSSWNHCQSDVPLNGLVKPASEPPNGNFVIAFEWKMCWSSAWGNKRDFF